MAIVYYDHNHDHREYSDVTMELDPIT